MTALAYTLVGFGLCLALAVFSYLDRIYRALDGGAGGRMHEHLEIFETEIEPHFKLERREAGLGFAILAQLCLIALAVETTHGVFSSVPAAFDAWTETVVYLLAEVFVCSQLAPHALLVRTTGRWLRIFLPAIRAALAATRPLRALLGLAISVAHITDEEAPEREESQQEAIEALVEAAQEEGIIEQREADLIEQVVEFGDKRVLEFMTPRPDIVAISAEATLARLKALLIQTKHSRVVVHGETLDDVLGIVHAQDLLQVSESDAARRTVKEMIQPVLFVPETKLGSELLAEMQRRGLQMAIAVDEHGSMAGIVTVADLVEEIVGEMGKDQSGHAVADVVEEPDGSVMLRGNVPVGRVQELFGVELADAEGLAATTVAGFVNGIAGHVPRRGEQLDYRGLHFEVVEASQRKVLRLRVRLLSKVPGK